MRIKLNTSCNFGELNSRIAESIDYSDKHRDMSETNNKLFYGINTSDGFLLSKKHDENDSLKRNIYRFKVVVKDGKGGKPELSVCFYPGIIHLCALILLSIIIVGKDHRLQFFNNPWMKALIGILLVAIVLVPNGLEYKRIRDDLISLCSK